MEKKNMFLQKVQRAKGANNCIPCSNSSKDTESISTSLVLIFIVIWVHYYFIIHIFTGHIQPVSFPFLLFLGLFTCVSIYIYI